MTRRKRVNLFIDLILPFLGLIVVILNALNGWWIVTSIWIVITIIWTVTLIDKIKFEKEMKEIDELFKR